MPASPSLPGGLVTLQQYLAANQPAVQRTQSALDTNALNPYQTALAGATSAANQAAIDDAQKNAKAQAQQTANTNAANAGPGPFNPVARVPYSASVSTDPNAAAILTGAQSGLQAAADQAGQATADASARQSSLYSMYGSTGYSLGDAGLDAALTGQTAAPNVAGDIANAISTAPTSTGTETARPNNLNPGPRMNPHVPQRDDEYPRGLP